MLSLWAGAMVEVRLGETRNVADMARALAKLVDESMLTQGAGPALWLRGWAEARLGSAREGFRLIREGYERHARLGMYAGNTETLGYAAEALLLAGDIGGAEWQLDEAMELVQRFKERMELPNLLLLYARVALARADEAAAQSFMRDALAEARSAGSPYFELKCLAALCEQPGADAADVEAMKRAHAALPHTHDTPFGQHAQRLIRT
jgi:hypothetical protein